MFNHSKVTSPNYNTQQASNITGKSLFYNEHHTSYIQQ